MENKMEMFDPAHPGELIRETLTGLEEETGKKLTIEQVAKGLGTTRKTLSAIINCKQSVSPEMALRLSKAFNTTPEFWLHAQENYDLAKARKKVDIREVKVFWHPLSA
jgi:addiction module HigA family antidote